MRIVEWGLIAATVFTDTVSDSQTSCRAKFYTPPPPPPQTRGRGCMKRGGRIKFLPHGASNFTPPTPLPCKMPSGEKWGEGGWGYIISPWAPFFVAGLFVRQGDIKRQAYQFPAAIRESDTWGTYFHAYRPPHRGSYR